MLCVRVARKGASDVGARGSPEDNRLRAHTRFIGTCTVVVGLVKATLGRFKGRLQATTTPSTTNPVAAILARAGRAMAPWTGSLLAAGLLLVAVLVWVNNAAYRGVTTHGWLLCLAAAVVICVWRLCTDINRSSIHPYYKQRSTQRRRAAGPSAAGGGGAAVLPLTTAPTARRWSSAPQ